MNIREAINLFIKKELNKEELYSVIGNVSNIRESERLCDVTPIDGAEIFDVRLSPVLSSDFGFVQIPKNDSVVTVTFVDTELAYLAQASELDKLIMIIGNSSVEITTDLVKFNDGSNEGMTKVIELTEKLNNLENDVNNLKAAFNSWVVVPSDGGAALKTAATTWSGQSLTVTQQADIENDKITH